MVSGVAFSVVLGLLLGHHVGASTTDLARAIARRADPTTPTPIPIALRNFGDQSYVISADLGGQLFNFTLSTTYACTMVAGTGCPNCTATPSSPKYDSSASQNYGTYLAPASNDTRVTLPLNGKNVTGGVPSDSCGFRQSSGGWWEAFNQKILVATQNGTDSSAFPSGTSGVAGMGTSGVPAFGYSIIGNLLGNSSIGLNSFTYALALFSSTVNTTADGTALAGDSSGGFMHVLSPDPNYYSGGIETQNVVSQSVVSSFGPVPAQLGSYDWTVQIQGWLFKNGDNTVNGGQGMYATVEPAYPYILLPQHDAYTIYAAIPGAKPYTVSANAVTSTGQIVYSDDLTLTYSVPCDVIGLVMYVNFNGTSIPLQPEDMWTVIGKTCVGNIRAWADPSRATAILGNAFFRNAYVVFTANKDSTTNTVGIANRLLAGASKNKSNTKVIIGSVVGGVGALLLIALLSFLLIRRYKGRARVPPSAIFTHQAPRSAAVRSNSGDDAASRAKSPASFFGFGSNRDSTYVAEPWMPPSEGANSEKVTVQPWSPHDGSEKAFLSPTGTAEALPYQPSPVPSPNHQMTQSSFATTTMYGGGGAPSSRSPQQSSTMSGYSISSQAPMLQQPQQQQPFSPPASSPGFSSTSYNSPPQTAGYNTSPNPYSSYSPAPPSGAAPASSPQYHSQLSSSPTSYGPQGHRPLPQVPFGGRPQ